MPICTNCKQEKSLEEFNFRNKEKQIPTSYCKQCNRVRTKAWRKTEEGSKKWKIIRDDKVKRVRAWVNEQRALGCQNCSEKRFYVIDFHHIDPSRKIFTLGDQSRYSSWKAIQEEIAKCKRLCANCHREEHYLKK